MPMPLVYLYANGNIGRMRIVIDTGVGFCVARSDRIGHSYEPQNVERATVRASRFIFVSL